MPEQDRAFGGQDKSATRWFAKDPNWWEEHYVDAVDSLLAFLDGDGLSLEGRRVLDLGCGGGIISLGLAQRGGAASVLGLDLQPVDCNFLDRIAHEHDVDPTCATLEFRVSEPDRLPVPDHSFDAVTTWSAFEHISEPTSVLKECHRALTPNGFLFLQVWPFFNSEHGSHLWPWFDQPFSHLRLEDSQLRAEVRSRTPTPELAEAMLDLYDSCNRITLDELGSSLTEAGFFIAKVDVMTNAFHIPPELQRMPLSLLATAGVKLLAVPQ